MNKIRSLLSPPPPPPLLLVIVACMGIIGPYGIRHPRLLDTAAAATSVVAISQAKSAASISGGGATPDNLDDDAIRQ
jgi:hypothetical protein